VQFEVTQNSIQFNVDGDIAVGKVKLGSNDSEKKEDQTLFHVTDDVTSSFALRYLNLFNKSSTLSNFVKLSLTSEQPLVVEYEIENLGFLKFFLAPKLSDD